MGYRRYGTLALIILRRCRCYSQPGLQFEDLIYEADDVGQAFTRIPKEVLSGIDASLMRSLLF